IFSGKIARNADVSCRKEDDDYALLYNPDIDDSVLIDRSGLVIWDYIEEPRSILEIMTYLTGSFSECPLPDTIRHDTESFLQSLIPGFVVESI
ncbi:MAG TPA: hypothetical protein VN372_04480, partial [Methanospirillum sp.]|nr:hypothetical protein [Methanospirillum sp.]